MKQDIAEIAAAERAAIVAFVRRTASIAGAMGKSVAAETARIVADQIEAEKHASSRAHLLAHSHPEKQA